MPNINPFEKKAPAPPPAYAPSADAKAAMLARATGGNRVLPMPAPANPVPGITGTPPLPVGKVVGHVAPSSLTDVERQTLQAAGWTEDIGLPTSAEGLKQIQQAVADQASRAEEVVLPVDPRTPPLKVTTVPLESLPPADQKRMTSALNDTIKTISQGEQQAAAAARNTSNLQAREMATKGTIQAVGTASKAVESFRQRVAREANVPLEDAPEVVAVNPAAEGAMALQHHFESRVEAQKEAATAPPPAPAAPPPRAQQSETGADAGLMFCPHCNWDLSVPDPIKAEHADKMSFLQCMIGDKPYAKGYDLFGGSVHVVFRTLTSREIDIIYKQTYADRQAGDILNELDYYERINRYRLFLQLQKFSSDGVDGFVHDLPDGYSKFANPHGSGFWMQPEQEKEMDPSQTALPTLKEWMVENVLKTEAVFRVVMNACNQFNRLVAKMEANSDNSDFLATDRGAVLTLRAAARGVVDFREARVLDVNWWRRTNALIRAMAEEDELVAIRAAFDLQRSLVGNSGLTDESFKGCQKSAQALFGDLVNCLHPWAATDAAKRKENQMGGLIDAYKRLVGDPDDPEYRKKLLHDLETLDRQDEVQVEESEATRIDRLLAERDAHYARIRQGGTVP